MSAHWVLDHLKNRAGIETRLLDLRNIPMPFFDQPVPPAMPGRAPYENEVVQRWTAEIARSDGFVFVTPEYNYGPPSFSRTHWTGFIRSGTARRPPS
jgi:NAD(P)H-dependent FMN reductase